MRKHTILFLLLILPVFTIAQKTIVSGSVTNGKGQVVRMLAFDDFISKKIIKLGESTVGNDGNFSMEFELKETVGAFLDINYQRAEIFLEPDASYSINISYDPANQLESYFDRQGLVYDFAQADEHELNHIIWQFNAMYNKFVMENFEHIVKLHDKARVADFRAEVDQTFADVDHPYFKDYMTYNMADVYQFARLKGKQALADDYFTDKPVLYNNVEYAFFFDEFFEKFLTSSPHIITISDLIIAVNDSSSNQMILRALNEVSYLKNEGFRELVLIHGLRSMYYNGTYKKPQLLSMIDDIKIGSHNPMHKRIAANLLKSLNYLAPGSPAPDLVLTNLGGHQFHLRDIKGKPILLTFFRSGQKGTKNSFENLAELYNHFRSGLEIISVSMDDDPEAFIPLANSGNYHWTFAHFGNNPSVLDSYDIRNLPMYVLIDVEGNISVYPAPPPGDELERAVMKVIH